MAHLNRISAGDLRRLLEAAESLHGAKTLEECSRRVASALRSLIACDFVSVDRFSDTSGMFRAMHVCMDPPLEPQIDQYVAAFQAYFHEHPLFDPMVRVAAAKPLRISDVAPDSHFRRLALYNEFYRKTDVNRQLIVSVRTSHATTLALCRGGREFSQVDKAVLEAIAPHCRSAWQASTYVEKLTSRHASFDRALASTALPLVLVTPAARVRFITPAAQRTLQRYFGARCLQSDRLPDDFASWLRHSLRARGAAMRLTDQVFAKESAKRRLIVKLVYLQEGGILLVLNTDEEHGASEIDTATVHLTSREQEVLHWIEQGFANADIAMVCGVSVRTVHKHVQNIFGKLNVESRTAAVRRARELASSPNVLRSSPDPTSRMIDDHERGVARSRHSSERGASDESHL